MSYSEQQFQISKQDIQDIVRQSNVAGLEGSEEQIIEDTLLRVRGSDERISLFQIDEVLRKLERDGTISKFGRKFVMEAMEEYASTN